MKNNPFPMLTKEMLETNQSSLEGGFEVSENMMAEKIYKNRNPMISAKGDIVFLKNGLLHNESGPALISYNLLATYYFINGEIRYEPDSPSGIVYRYEGKIEDGKFVPPSGLDVASYLIYTSSHHSNHCVFGPCVKYPFDEKTDSYWIDDKIMSKKLWEEHHEVVEYFKKLRIKNKMSHAFGENNAK